jgi:hypothetical protein
MPVIEYMLLALLGTAGAAAPGGIPSSPSTRTLDADAVTQPNGGTAGLLGQATSGSPGKRSGSGGHVGGRSGRGKVRTAGARRHHRRGHRHSKVYRDDKGGKKATKNSRLE